MALHRIHCQEPWFSLLRSGKKPVEGRKNSSLYQRIIVGDSIEFFCGKEHFLVLVVGINRYSSVKQYLEHEGLERALPGVASIEAGLAIYHAWNTPENIARFGFLGIQIQLMN